MRTSIVAATTAALCLAIAGPAAADSIVYIKDHDVWIANPDGSGQHQVTKDGEADWRYSSPTQADDGTIVAAKGTDIVRLKQNGQVLSSFDPPPTTDSAGQHIDGIPLGVAVSPDGSKVAYTYTQTNCPPGASCATRSVTMYSHSDRATPADEFGKLYRRNPSWVTNSRILVFGGYQQQVNVDDVGGPGDSDVHWFDDEDLFDPSTDLGDGELSRQGDRLAILRGYGDSLQLMFMAVSGDVANGAAPPAPPKPACATGTEPTLDNPTWSPDGRTIAFAHKDGIETLHLPNVVENDCPGAESGRVVIPGGSDPDWGPADVNPGPDDPPPPPPPCADPGSCDPPPPPPPAAELVVRGPKKASAKSARKGLAFRVSMPAAGTVRAQAKLGRRTVGSGSARRAAAGPVTVKVRLSAKALKKGSVKVTFTFKPAGGGAPVVRSLSLKVTR